MCDFVERGDILWHLEQLVAGTLPVDQLLSSLIISTVCSCATYTLRTDDFSRTEEQQKHVMYNNHNVRNHFRSLFLSRAMQLDDDPATDSGLSASDACISVVLRTFPSGFAHITDIDWFSTSGWFRWLTLF